MGVVETKDGKVYAIGGADEHGALNSVEVLDTMAPAPQWTRLPATLRSARYALGATVGMDGKIYAIGGMNGSFDILDTVEVYDPSEADPRWTTLHARLNFARKSLAAVTGLDGKIYAMSGGGRYGRLDSVEVFDPIADMPRWNTLAATLSAARQDFAAVNGSDGRIYAIGGYGERGRPLDTVEALDPAATRWTLLPATLPEPRYGHAAVVGLEGKIYVLGGRIGATVPIHERNTTPSDASETSRRPRRARVDRAIAPTFSLDTVVVYDPTATEPRWERLTARLTTPRERFGAVTASDGKLYAIGGVDLTIHPIDSTELLGPIQRAPVKPSAPAAP
jgi:influenza virus NS1A-binding protein